MNSTAATSVFWYVIPYGERFRMAWEKDARRNLREELLGNPIAQTWVAPEYEIIGKGAWPDWMAYWVPLLSQKALDILREYVEPCCELLPWIRLARKANEAEAVGRGHGVSGSKSNLGEGSEVAKRGELEKQGFAVKDTGTPKNPEHVTIEMPNPVTKEDAARFNSCFQSNSCPK